MLTYNIPMTRHNRPAHKAICKAWRKKERGLAGLAMPDAAISDFEMLAEICSTSMAANDGGGGGSGGGGGGGGKPALALVTSRTTVDALESHNAEMERSRPQLYVHLLTLMACALAARAVYRADCNMQHAVLCCMLRAAMHCAVCCDISLCRVEWHAACRMQHAALCCSVLCRAL